MMSLLRLLGLSLCFVSSMAHGITGDPEAGQSKTGTCVACHQVDGNSVVPEWPKIAGQHEQYLYRQLLAFKQGQDGPRYNPQMLGMVAALSEQDMADLAAFYATQAQSTGHAQAELVELGEQLYKGGILTRGIPSCGACHGPAGMGNAQANFPRLAGQHAAYTVSQLKAFRSHTRKGDMNGMMRLVAQKMTDAEIEAVSSYIEGLGPREVQEEAVAE